MENIIKQKRTMKTFAPTQMDELKSAMGVSSGVLAGYCEKITRWSIYLLAFFIPLFFLPWTSNVLDFNKQTLLLCLGFVAFASWMVKNLVVAKAEFDTGVINIFPPIFLAAMSAATYFSLSRYGSFWGWPLHVSENLITLILLTVVYFLVVNTFQKEKIFYLFLSLAFSNFIAMIFGLLQMFGVFVFPFDFSKTVSFNTVGTPFALSFLAAVLLPLATVLLLKAKGAIRLVLIAAIIADLLVLIIIQYTIAWWMVGLSAILLITVGTVRKNFFGNSWLFLPMIFLVFALLFGIFKFQLPGFPSMPSEILLSQKAGLEVSLKVLKDNLFLGSGPGTFAYNWAKYKPQAINATPFWNIRFSNSSSKFFDVVSQAGILGALSFLALAGAFIFWGAKQLSLLFLNPVRNIISNGAKRDGIGAIAENDIFWLLKFGILASFITLAIGYFLYPANITSDFVFFLLIAGFVGLASQNKKEFSFEGTSAKTLFIAFAFICVFALGMGVFIVAGQRYIADIKYTQGIVLWQAGKGSEAISRLEKAVSLNNKSDMYWAGLAQIYLSEFNRQALRKDISQTDAGKIMQDMFTKSIGSAVNATKIEPNNSLDWSTLAFIYQSFSGVAQGAEDSAVVAYDEALKREPANPYYFTQKGISMLRKAILLSEDQADEKDRIISMAQDEFDKAISLKSDYAPAHFQIAVIYQLQGKTSDAIKKLEETKIMAPGDVGVAFQLGLLYYQNKNYDKAVGEFERAVAVSPNYSNALYFLGLSYDQLGRKTAAISQFQKVLDLNPDNSDVKTILANLRAGRTALSGIAPEVPPTAPIEEKPASGVKKTK